MQKYNYAYTLQEGGRWIALASDASPLALERQCQDPSQWGLRMGGKAMTRLFLTADSSVWFHSLRFPDGRIWDSAFRRFRTDPLVQQSPISVIEENPLAD